ncbi:hypothetical protein VTH06DRAFT_3428 [Thermothelomyces fergusii]
MRLFPTLPSSILLFPILSLPFSQAYTPLSNSFLKSLPSPSTDDYDPANGTLLAPLLIPRVPGTPGQKAAQEHLAAFFAAHLPQWEVRWQNSTSTTPVTGDRAVPFANLIARRDPPRARRRGPGAASYLTLVAHYDSKREPDGFVGATDSAAPCAILMDVARAVDGFLQKLWAEEEKGEREWKDVEEEEEEEEEKEEEKDKEKEEGAAARARDEGVQILFLDGEEAFDRWTDTDSLYGARALAEEWETTANPAGSRFKSPMQQISLFVLLDLLGAPGPRVPSYFQSTHWAYQRMATLEARLRQLGLLESKPEKPFLPEGGKMATDFSGGMYVGDDHVPFMQRGAPVLHLIPTPFPDVWHTLDDDGKHLDVPTVKDWARIVTAFTLEWMDVQKTERQKDGRH